MNYRSLIVRRHGGPEVWEIVEDDVHPPDTGQVRIKVLAAAVSRIHVSVRRGEALYSGTFLGQELPFTPGYSVIAARLPISQAAAANALLESGQVTGNVVLDSPDLDASL